MGTLRVVSLTDSFESAWPGLAGAAGLGFEKSELVADLAPRGNAITVISAAGAEADLASALRGLPPGNRFIAAVGSTDDYRVAIAAIHAGATDYFALPTDLALLERWIAAGAERIHTEEKATAFTAGEREKYQFDGILGRSPALLAALDRAARVIPRPAVTVLIAGETGTGKELLARAIHYNGPRRGAPFVDVNCAAIPDNLLESELFGHEKGAFTGATAAKPGLMELANGGTLFLDEIGHLPLPLQGKLLRALEERAMRRVGGSRSIPVDVRIVAASHVDLESAVKRGEFREDLFYRLNVLPITLPPLRARPDDVVPIAEHFLQRFGTDYGIPGISFSAGAKQVLRERRWPGNVRELRNAIERAVLLASTASIDATDLAESTSPTAGSGELPFPATVDQIVRAAAEQMVELCNSNKSEAARRLGISRPRLQRLLDADPGASSSINDARDESND